MALNPFNWTGPVTEAVSRGPFTARVAGILKGGTHMALFGPRGTGKTTFLGELAGDLGKEQDSDAPEWELVIVDLRRAISLPAFIGSVLDGLDNHPSKRLRRRARGLLREAEKEIGVDFGVVKGGLRTGRREINEAEVLHAQLAALGRVADRVVVALDEFQRLNTCPGQPLSIIRSALMGPDMAGHVSLLLTGSLRERLELMLHSDKEPIWDQTLDLELPGLDGTKFIDYLEHRFEATGRPIDERAIEHLVELTDLHPKRTQHLAWYVWDHATAGTAIETGDVQAAFEELLDTSAYNSDFARAIDTLLSGNDTEVNEVRALFLLGAGGSPGSDLEAKRYGLTDGDATARALIRLKDRGMVSRREGRWHIVDPLLAEWLKRQDPLGSDQRLLRGGAD